MNFTCKKCGFYFNHTNLIDVDCPVCDGKYLKIENVMKKEEIGRQVLDGLMKEEKENLIKELK